MYVYVYLERAGVCLWGDSSEGVYVCCLDMIV